jgi:NADPH-dependent glutamate synthase beta subunit-like oxidoreductase
MTRLTIDNIPLTVDDGSTIMQAAAQAGIEIPSLCYRPGFSNHPSCMVCLVKDMKTGNFIPSCAYPAEEGMIISTHAHDVKEARREALELLLSDHTGDCEAPCRQSCPAFMDIPRMNRMISQGRFEDAIRVVREEIAIPLILGYICPAPCEKACRRKPIDEPVSICMLKRFTALREKEKDGMTQLPVGRSGKKVSVIGSGPAGLSAAFYLLKNGHECVIYDANEKPGGALRYSIPADLLPPDALDSDIDHIRRMGARFILNKTVDGDFFEKFILPLSDAVILALGGRESSVYQHFGIEADSEGLLIKGRTFETNRPGVFACRSNGTGKPMAVRASAHGKAAARSASLYMTGIPDSIKRFKFHSAIGHLLKEEWDEYKKESEGTERVKAKNEFPEGYSAEEAVREARRCMHCDCRKPETCRLRIVSEEYSANRKRFAGPGRKPLTKVIQHDIVVYEPEKCIRCGLCVEITRRGGESLGLAFIGRGFDVRIGVPFNQTVKDALVKTAEACVASCPTGALAKNNEQ